MENLDTKQVLKSVKKIEIRTKRLVDGLLQGAYHSIFKGRGIEFSEVRQYSFGDDIRTIDWNVTARMNDPYVKEYIEERDLTVYIVFDISGSSFFGSNKSKMAASIELATSLMFSAIRNNDNVGLVLFSEGVERFIPPRKGRKHILKLIREMIYHNPKSRKTNIKETLKFITNVVKRRSIMFLISDFFDSGYSKYLKTLSLKHDLIAINIRDIREKEIPDIGFIELEDEETGEQILVDTSDPVFQTNFRKLVSKRHREIKNKMQKMNIDLITLYSDESFEVPFRKFFYRRIH